MNGTVSQITPPSPLLPREWFWRVNLAHEVRTLPSTCAVTAHEEVGGGMGSPLAGYTPNKEYSFLMISPKLFDFSPFFFLISSPLGLRIFWCYLSFQVTAILCYVAKNSLRGTCTVTFSLTKLRTHWITFALGHSKMHWMHFHKTQLTSELHPCALRSEYLSL
jgi:hypothetical protein